ncbi:flagellar biosynthetic protein FliO [Virgibacillus sp. SK37]|uniref:flagellar biosynthetic protein FliO n=1 Tax=Virgibacillus sp. SK37 TaxID=403957 RepID=UPI0004D1C626|nr:flagellar biosynthetic protein FliO [Virgibacillus sp. SK37]AIF43749.1 flagellar protein [Virgibacillus sp. SK37]
MYKQLAGLLIVITLMVTFSTTVSAEDPSVNDCMEEGANCEKLDTQDKNTENESTVLNDQEEEGSLIIELIKMFFALVLVLGLIYLLLKFLSKRNKLFNQVRALENLGGVSLGQNKSVQIVRVGNRFYLVGVGENVELLEEITDQEVIDDLVNKNTTTHAKQGTGLSGIFQKESQHDGNNKQDFNKLFSSELNKLKAKRSHLLQQRKDKEDSHE